MNIGKLYHKIVLTSPRVEVMVRKLYWDNVKYLKKFIKVSSIDTSEDVPSADFKKVLKYLRENGVAENDTIVVHSSYGALSGTKLSAEEIIEGLISLIGRGGTLAMPAIRHFAEEGEGDDYILNYINNELKNTITLYDIYRSPVTSGLLPFTLMRYDDAEVSRFPLNPLVAVGAFAADIMKGNVEGNLPSAHGPNSAWARCADLNAWNIGIGIEMKEFLTMFHICQEDDDWPVKEEEWYFERDFIIKSGKERTPLRIRERKHKWTKYFAESNFYNDMIKSSILKSTVIDGIPVFMVRSKDMLDFIKSKNNPTYPYLIPKKFLKSGN